MDQAYDSGVFLEGKSFRSQNKKQFYTQNSGYFEAVKNDQLEWVSPAYAAMKSLENNVESTEEKAETPKDIRIDSVVIYFDYDQYKPIPSSLDKAVGKINTLSTQNSTAKVIGHTDQQGNSPYNVELSKKRALYIQKWMEDQFDIQVVAVEYKSFNQLINSQESEESFAQNRRVVILFETKIR
jgi:outer membrane protein OmpA-like peptidoglycan-associated protein